MGRTVVGKKRPKKVVFPMDIIRDRKYRRSGPVTCYKVERGVFMSNITNWQEFLEQPREVRRTFLDEHSDLTAAELAQLLGTTTLAVSGQRKHCGARHARKGYRRTAPLPSEATNTENPSAVEMRTATISLSESQVPWVVVREWLASMVYLVNRLGNVDPSATCGISLMLWVHPITPFTSKENDLECD